MAHPSSYRPRPGDIPTDPGVYRFRDPHGRVIYVGKAKNLRNRLNSYFANVDKLHPRTHTMVTTAASVEWTVVASEREALQLEYTWIKEFDPRFNIQFRDDKSYPYLAVTINDKYPRVHVVRGPRKKGVKYYGPYVKAWAIRETIDLLLRVFPVRTCTTGVFNRAQASGRPCLLGYIDKCSAPCVGNISQEDHQRLAQQFCQFMSGKAKQFIQPLEVRMAQASEDLDFELAARLRDDIAALRSAFEKSAMVLPLEVDADVFNIHEDDLEAAAQVFHVRGGRIRGQRGWVVEKTEEATTPELLEHLVQQVYGGEEGEDIPRDVWVPQLPANAGALESWLRQARGGAVRLTVPRRGEKAALLETVRLNAVEGLRLHKSKRAGDITTRSQGLHELQEILGLSEPPLRIEGIDVSHTQGTNVVASLVVLEDGLPKKSEYRKFAVTGEAARDDTAAMYDVVRRRFTNYLEKKEKFSYPPNLLVVDGGPPQVNVAAQALEELGLREQILVCGLAKRLEEVWLPGDPFPLVLPRASQGMFMLQRLRDEAHRFAITFHRSKRAKSMVASELDGIAGLGPARRKALLAHFGSVRKIRAATVEDLMQVPGVGAKQAASIHGALNAGDAAGEAASELPGTVNMVTGEILDP